MEKDAEKVYREMIDGLIENYKYTSPGISVFFREAAYLLGQVAGAEEEKNSGALIDNPWVYLVQYDQYESDIPVLELSSVSLCLAFKMLIWSRIHPDRLLYFLIARGGEENGQHLPYPPLALIEKVIGAWLDAGLSYESKQEYFDRLLSAHQTCREMIFPLARYPSSRVKVNTTSLRILLKKARTGRSYEKNIPLLVSELLRRLNAGETGIFPYYSRKRAGEDHAKLLTALIMRNGEAFFYIRNQDTYYEISQNTAKKENK